MINRVTFLRSKSDDVTALLNTFPWSKLHPEKHPNSLAWLSKALYLLFGSCQLSAIVFFLLQTLFQEFWTFCSLPKRCFSTLYHYTYLEYPSLLFFQLSFFLSLKTWLNHKFLCKIFLGVLHFTSQPTQAICQLIFPLWLYYNFWKKIIEAKFI